MKLEKSQQTMKTLYDRKTENRTFSPGDPVLALLPLVASPFQATFAGPYSVVRQVSDQNYVISTPDRKRSTQLCHINLLKPYFSRVVSGSEAEVKLAAVAVPLNVAGSLSLVETEVDELDCRTQGRLNNSESLCKLDTFLEHLPRSRHDMCSLIRSYPTLFSDVPSRTHLVEHDIDVGEVTPIKQRFYRNSPEKRAQLESEVAYMLDNGIAEP